MSSNERDRNRGESDDGREEVRVVVDSAGQVRACADEDEAVAVRAIERRDAG